MTDGSARSATVVPAPESRPLRIRARAWLRRPWSWLALALVLAVARLPTFQLWGDVRYTLGVERVTARTGWSAAEVWAHRPLLDRQLMAVLDALTAGPFREQQLLGWGALGCGLSGWVLYRGLSRHLGGREAVGASAALLVALVWTPPRTLLQPEWFALLTAALAVGVAASATRRDRGAEWGIAVIVGLLLAATVLMKWTTVGTAAAAWAVVVALAWGHWGRVVRITVATAVLTPLILGVQVLAVPHEGAWLLEVSGLNPTPDALQWCSLLEAPTKACGLQNLVANEAVVSPVLLLLPAAVVLLARSSAGRRRLAAVLLPVIGLASTLATAVVQAQWFSYHVAAAATLAGVWVGWALARWSRVTRRPAYALIGPALVAGPLFAALLSLPLATRTSTVPSWFGLTPAYATFLLATVLAAVALVLAVRAEVPTPADAARRRPAVVAGLAVIALLAVFANPLLPRTGFTMDFQAADKTGVEEHTKSAYYRALADRIRARIGADTPVVYLSFGERAYWLENPTYCRYAAATFLQRSVWTPTRGLGGFSENLACLADPRAAYVVIEPEWLKLPRTDPLVRDELAREYDCSRPVIDEKAALVCPRR